MKDKTGWCDGYDGFVTAFGDGIGMVDHIGIAEIGAAD